MIQDNNKINHDAQSLQMAVSGSVKLISMVDYVIKQQNILKDRKTTNTKAGEAFDSIFDYADFLKQRLELWMFIPCDKDGNVLKEPRFYYTDKNLNKLDYISKGFALEQNKNVEIYKKAKDRCLFENTTQLSGTGISDYLKLFPNNTVEDLIKYNVNLSKTAINITRLEVSSLTDR